MDELEVTVSDRVLYVILGVFGFALVFNIAYSLQRGYEGFVAIRMWIALIMICLVAGPMRDRKTIAYFVMLGVAILLEYHRERALAAAAGREFSGAYTAFLVLLIYGTSLRYLIWFLFARLDHLGHAREALAGEVAGMSAEALRVGELAARTSRKTEALAADGVPPASTFALYRRAFTELFAARVRKDIPGCLMRALREGFGIQRGMVLELSGTDATVRETWGDAAAAAAPSPVSLFSASLVKLAVDKGGAVLESELASEGDHARDFQEMCAAGREPVGLFPVVRAGGAGSPTAPQFVVVALRPHHRSALEWYETAESADADQTRPRASLRLVPIQKVLDICGEILGRALPR
jgi:hypothetical protein